MGRPKTRFEFWCAEMKEAEKIFRGANRPDFAKGIKYARQTAEKVTAEMRAQPKDSSHAQRD